MAETAGNIIPIDRTSKLPVAKEEYTQAIQEWCRTRSVADALSREEIGALRRDDRIDAQRKTLIEGMAHYLREHERSDVAMGVYLVLTLLSDNEKGCASISQPTLAKLFGRSVSSIAEAQKRLKDDGLIIMGRGRYAGTYPVIPRAMVQTYNHMTWLVAAICDHEKPVNLPAGPVDCQSTGQTLGLSQSTGQTLGLENVNQPVNDAQSTGQTLCNFSKVNSTTLDSACARDESCSGLKAATIALAASLVALPAAAEVKPPAIAQPANVGQHLNQLANRLFEAGGAALANCSSLEWVGEVEGWIAQGCDLECDILPIIRARAKTAPPESIRSWGYFRQAVANAKAARLAPMPEGQARPQTQRFDDGWETNRRALEYLKRRKECQ